MTHIVLAGDSIFDNMAYVNQGQAVIELLTKKSNGDFKATLVAEDGAVTSDLARQFDQMPPDMTHLYISSGGNDALESAYLLAENVSTAFEAMGIFAKVVEEFQRQYRSMLNNAVTRAGNIVLCSIYDSIPGYDKEPLTALKLFNEVILREAFAFGLPVMDLRLICEEPEDYSSISPIEPSGQGGDKISDVIVNLLRQHNFSTGTSTIWTR